MTVSIIVPTLNEADNIGKLINFFKKYGNQSLIEIIVVDAHSHDDTEGVARKHGAVVLQSTQRSRAAQMNLGAKTAKGDILYFVHADCTPPESFIADILSAVTEGYPIGCYRYKFDSNLFLLKFNGFFTRFQPLWCRGGDETLFITREVFSHLKGFDERYVIMEEYDFIRRARSYFAFKIIPKYALVSARKYHTNGWLRVQLANLTAFRMFNKGAEPVEIAATYRNMLNYR
jgi:rSAM/selenodomain-associated transferase 2